MMVNTEKCSFAAAILACSITISGCATARLSQGPDIQSLKSHTGAAQVAVAMVEDARGTTHAGSIGATTINVPSSVTGMVYRYLVKELNSNFGVSIQNSGADKTIVSKITSIKVSSFDAIMQPVQTQIRLDLSVCGREGSSVYQRSYQGDYEERLGFSLVDAKTGELVESAVQRLIKEIVNDVELKKILST